MPVRRSDAGTKTKTKTKAALDHAMTQLIYYIGWLPSPRPPCSVIHLLRLCRLSMRASLILQASCGGRLGGKDLRHTRLPGIQMPEAACIDHRSL